MSMPDAPTTVERKIKSDMESSVSRRNPKRTRPIPVIIQDDEEDKSEVIFQEKKINGSRSAEIGCDALLLNRMDVILERTRMLREAMPSLDPASFLTRITSLKDMLCAFRNNVSYLVRYFYVISSTHHDKMITWNATSATKSTEEWIFQKRNILQGECIWKTGTITINTIEELEGKTLNRVAHEEAVKQYGIPGCPWDNIQRIHILRLKSLDELKQVMMDETCDLEEGKKAMDIDNLVEFFARDATRHICRLCGISYSCSCDGNPYVDTCNLDAESPTPLCKKCIF